MFNIKVYAISLIGLLLTRIICKKVPVEWKVDSAWLGGALTIILAWFLS